MTAATRSIRLIVGFCGDPPSRASLDLAAEIARLMSARLSALMIENIAAASLGAIPFAREYVSGRSAWQEIGRDDIESRRLAAFRRARQLIEDVARLHGMNSDFEWAQEQPQTSLSSALAGLDIVAIAAPASVGEWMTLPFAGLLDESIRSNAPVLVLPGRAKRIAGSVAVIAISGSDPAIELAGTLARASGEQLIVISSGWQDSAEQTAAVQRKAGITPQQVRIVDAGYGGTSGFAGLLSELDPGITVISRNSMSVADLQRITRAITSRGTAVLLAGRLND